MCTDDPYFGVTKLHFLHSQGVHKNKWKFCYYIRYIIVLHVHQCLSSMTRSFMIIRIYKVGVAQFNVLVLFLLYR